VSVDAGLDLIGAALPTTGAPVTLRIAYSGGRDSHVLLHWLAGQRAALAPHRLRAIHVDHGLHPDSASWTDHCAAVCAALGVPLDVRRVDARPARGESAEAAEGGPSPAHAGVVAANMSFYDLMIEFGFDAPSIQLIEKAVRNVYDFRKIYPGQRYEVFAAEDGSVESMRFSERGDEAYIDINLRDGAVSAEKKEYEYDLRLCPAGGTISTSLFAALDAGGIPPELGHKLADLFAWDIDFHNDMRRGDYFRMIYEEKTRRADGMRKLGRIVAAEFYARGKSHCAFMFDNGAGGYDYFDENGKALRKQLLRAPLSYTRISSNFSHRRFHPVLHHYAPHYGIDYAAPTGTPVMATGNGTVIAAERKGGNGNYVKVKHPNGYVTYYLHLSRFGKGIRAGAHVNQGQVIGYVGSTGYATGPHLDYRVQKNGKFVNPRTISLPPADPVSRAKMASFIDMRDRHLSRLSNIATGGDGEAFVSGSDPGVGADPARKEPAARGAAR
jgi:murein DD-endopeptidase MepM/ murein hydrolase activator NlpD